MAFEIAFLLFLAVGVIAIGRPIVAAYLEKTKFKYRELGSEAEDKLDKRIEFLQAEVLDLKQRMVSMQESVEFLSQEQQTIIKVQEKKQA